MKKIDNKGFTLAETLIVTTFVSTVLIVLLIEFTKLSSSYNISFDYNTVEDLFALEDVRNWIENNDDVSDSVDNALTNNNPYQIYDSSSTNCSLENLSQKNELLCPNLLLNENISKLILTSYDLTSVSFDGYMGDKEFMEFINLLKGTKDYKYRLIAKFNDGTYATLGFGDKDE